MRAVDLWAGLETAVPGGAVFSRSEQQPPRKAELVLLACFPQQTALMPMLIDNAEEHSHSSDHNTRNQRATRERHMGNTLRITHNARAYTTDTVVLFAHGRYAGRVTNVSRIGWLLRKLESNDKRILVKRTFRYFE